MVKRNSSENENKKTRKDLQTEMLMKSDESKRSSKSLRSIRSIKRNLRDSNCKKTKSTKADTYKFRARIKNLKNRSRRYFKHLNKYEQDKYKYKFI